MSQEEKVEGLSAEQLAAAKQTAEHGRVANLDEAAAKAAKAAAGIKEDEETGAELFSDTAKKEAAAKTAEAEAAAAAEKAAADKQSDDWKAEWVVVGNPHADAAVGLMKNAGMSPVEGNAVFEKAIASGDINDVNWEVLEARLGKDTALMVRTGVEQYYNTEYTAQKAVQDYAYENVGGEKGWVEVQTWAKKLEATDPAFARDLGEWRAALKIGGFAAKAAVDAIKTRYEGVKGTFNKQIERGGTPQAGGDVKGMTRGEYYVAMEKAGGDRAPQHIKDALKAQRLKGREQGI